MACTTTVVDFVFSGDLIRHACKCNSTIVRLFFLIFRWPCPLQNCTHGLWGEIAWNKCGVIFAVAKGLVDVHATIHCPFFVFSATSMDARARMQPLIVRFCFFGDPNGCACINCPFFVSSFCGDLNRRACHATHWRILTAGWLLCQSRKASKHPAREGFVLVYSLVHVLYCNVSMLRFLWFCSKLFGFVFPPLLEQALEHIVW